MNDDTLKALINNKAKNKYMYGDYVRIVNSTYSRFINGIRMVSVNHDASNEDFVDVYMTNGASGTWRISKVEQATREEYVDYMTNLGEVPRHE